jgi:dUTP pyrophosphatase
VTDLRFRRLSDAAVLPKRAYAHDAGLDLCAAEELELAPGERGSVGTGFAIEIPEGRAGLVLPRSGLAAKHGITITNAPGLIDAGYRGELRVLLLNADPTETFSIAVGDRVAQLVLVRVETPAPVEVSELATSERAERGFGSSGVSG